MRRLSILVLGLAAAAVLAGEAPKEADQAARIAKLCKELGETQYGSMPAFEQLVAIGAPAVPKLLEALKDRRPQARWWAVAAVCRLAPDEGYAPVLDVLKNDPDDFVRSTAVYHLRHYGKKGKDIWPAVEEALTDKSAEVARWALRLMMEDGCPKFEDSMRKILASGSSELRSYALEYVRTLGEKSPAKGKAYEPLVRQLLGAADPLVRCDAMHTMVKMKETGQLDFLREMYKTNQDARVKEVALRCVTVVPNPPVDALDFFIEGLGSGDEKVRDAAFKILIKGVKHYDGFDPKGPLPMREAAIAKWRAWLAANRAQLTYHPDLRKFLLPGDRPKADEKGGKVAPKAAEKP
jgi:HEAT repeat protein